MTGAAAFPGLVISSSCRISREKLCNKCVPAICCVLWINGD